jgi:cell division transport system permease protein
MKNGAIRYLIKEGFRNIRCNFSMSLSSVVILICCLFIIGSVVVVSRTIDEALNAVEAQNHIIVYLDSDISELDAQSVGTNIGTISNISESTFCSKETAIEKFRDNTTSDVYNLLKENNPAQPSFRVSVKDLSKYDETSSALKELDGVESVTDCAEWAKKLTNFNNMFSYISICVILIFVVISLFIISNTIRVTMYSRRKEISIMKSVGATNLFIRVPFIVEGIIIGLIAALCTSGVLKIAFELLLKVIQDLIPIVSIFEGPTWALYSAFIGMGILCGVLGGTFSIARYLRTEGGEVFG